MRIRFFFRLLCIIILALAVFEIFSAIPPSQAQTHGDDQDEEEAVDFESLTKELEEKKTTLEQKQRSVEEQEKRVTEQREELDKKLKEMERIRSEITGELEKQRQNNEERVSKMVVVFETMTPKAAAGVLESLDDWLSVEVLKRMDSKRMAKVMNIMDKERSAKLSELLTGYYHPDKKKVQPTGQAVEQKATAPSGTSVPAEAGNTNQKGGKT